MPYTERYFTADGLISGVGKADRGHRWVAIQLQREELAQDKQCTAGWVHGSVIDGSRGWNRGAPVSVIRTPPGGFIISLLKPNEAPADYN